jgi:hypothetical protein
VGAADDFEGTVVAVGAVVVVGAGGGGGGVGDVLAGVGVLSLGGDGGASPPPRCRWAASALAMSGATFGSTAIMAALRALWWAAILSIRSLSSAAKSGLALRAFSRAVFNSWDSSLVSAPGRPPPGGGPPEGGVRPGAFVESSRCPKAGQVRSVARVRRRNTRFIIPFKTPDDPNGCNFFMVRSMPGTYRGSTNPRRAS